MIVTSVMEITPQQIVLESFLFFFRVLKLFPASKTDTCGSRPSLFALDLKLVPRVSHLTDPWPGTSEEASGGGKMRDPGNDVG